MVWLESTSFNTLLPVGMPFAVSTVDKYQGQQNDYILLSLVRTSSVGHLRDVRRLVVALSRARLGLYVFCRQRVFENCFELSPSFGKLLSRPNQLQLVVGEGYPGTRPTDTDLTGDKVLNITDVTAMGVLVYQMIQQSQHMTAQILSEQKKAVTLEAQELEVGNAEMEEEMEEQSRPEAENISSA